jgi:hypothetical protein
MPVEFGLWRIDGDVVRVTTEPMADESRLEHVLETDINILGLDLLLVIGRQVVTAFGKRIDLLAINSQGTLYGIEIKRDKTPRDVVAQALDYGSWIANLSAVEIADLYERYRPGETLGEAFAKRFDQPMPQDVNQAHQLIIVASMLDPSTERIVSYLAAYDVPINVVFFSYFKDGQHEYLARSWLLDPVEAEARAASSQRRTSQAHKVTGTWNGQDFYVSLGDGPHRAWDDCVKYGFISAGQGQWYSQSLETLFPGARVFVYIPKVGYVGVGVVRETATRIKDFKVTLDGKQISILDIPDLKAPKMWENADDPELSEYAVGIEWLQTLPPEQAIREKGLFANQNSACRLRDQNTIERLVKAFHLDE